MALVNRSSITALKEIRSKAENASSYTDGYHTLMEGLTAAIAQLEQLAMLTDTLEFSVTVNNNKVQ